MKRLTRLRWSGIGALVVVVTLSAVVLSLAESRDPARRTRVSTAGPEPTAQGVRFPANFRDRNGDYAMSAVEDDYVFLFGGRVQRGGSEFAPGDGARYDVKTRSWIRVAAPEGLTIGSAISYSDRSATYVLGNECTGQNHDLESEEPCRPGTLQVLRYEISHRKWDRLGTPERPADSIIVAIGAAGGKVYVATEPPQLDSALTFDSYDLVGQRWEHLPSPDRFSRSLCFSGGRLVSISWNQTLDGVVVPSDQSPPGLPPTGSVNVAADAWNETNGAWVIAAPTPNLAGTIGPHVVCGTSRVMIAATVGPGTDGPVAVFSPASGEWQSLPPASVSATGQVFVLDADLVNTWSGSDHMISAGPDSASWTDIGEPPAPSTSVYRSLPYGRRTMLVISRETPVFIST